MVFQNYALYPHMTVYDNIAYGLRVRHVPKTERRARVEHAASMLGLNNELGRKPSQLSGGQRQRVAMGRAIVRRPEAFLMDEPLSNLDARLRVQMRTEIARLQRELGVTTVYVTHDQVEAMTMADRVAVLRGGVLQQFDTPQRVYAYPVNLFVAIFIGSPAMNVVEGELSRGDGGVECRIGSHRIALPDQLLADEPALARAIGRTVAVGIRPEAISVVPDHQNGLRGTVVVSEELGSEVVSHIEIEATPVSDEAIVEGLTDDVAAGMAPRASTARAGTTVVVARLDAETNVPRGTSLSLVFDTSKLHFFDRDDGRTLRARPVQPEQSVGRADPVHLAPPGTQGP
jgi:multiple sugar transport system ATP-binding protein